jgi:esterase
MKLHYRIIGEGTPLIILHGLFGSSDNWRTMATLLSSNRQVVTVDLRNHGQSPQSDLMSYQLMADDVAELIDDLGLSQVEVIGHSIGGKVAMVLAANYAKYIDKLIVTDIAPKSYPDRHSNTFEALLDLNLSVMTKRAEADKALSLKITNKTIRQFLLMNIVSEDGVIKWQLNLPALSEKYPKLLEAVCEGQIIKHRSLFLRGSLSDYIENDDVTQLKQQFPNATITTIEQAGHWIHAEKPDLFIAAVQQFLNDD